MATATDQEEFDFGQGPMSMLPWNMASSGLPSDRLAGPRSRLRLMQRRGSPSLYAVVVALVLVVFAAAETLFLRGGGNFPVAHQRCRGIVIVGRDP